MNKSKYHIRVMRPRFERAILTVEASCEKAAVQSALEMAGRLTDNEWRLLASEKEPPVVEIALSEEETESSRDEIVAFLNEIAHAYALLQANLAEGDGSFIVPNWLRRQPDIAIVDITQDWNDALAGIYKVGVEEFIAWIARQNRPTNAVDFFAECNKRQ